MLSGLSIRRRKGIGGIIYGDISLNIYDEITSGGVLKEIPEMGLLDERL